MKIFEVLKHLEKQSSLLNEGLDANELQGYDKEEQTNIIAAHDNIKTGFDNAINKTNASEKTETSGTTKDSFSKKQASAHWSQTVDVKKYVDKIIFLLSKIAALSKDECEKTVDISRLKSIYYLIHNSIPAVNKNLEMLKMFNIYGGEKGTNNDIYDKLQEYILYINPQSLEQLQNLYDKRKNNGGITIKEYESNGNTIENFTQFISTNTGLEERVIKDLRQIIGTRTPNRGQYELLLSLISNEGKMNVGKGGDVLIEGVGIEVKADNSVSGSSAGRLGGQRSGFNLTVSNLAKSLKTIVKTYADDILKPLIEKLNDGIPEQVQLKNNLNEIYNKYTSLDIAIDPGYDSNDKRCSLDTAIIEITRPLLELNNDVDLIKLKERIINVLEEAWTIFIVENNDDKATGATISTIKNIIGSYFRQSGNISGGEFIRTKNNKQINLTAFFDDQTYHQIIKLIGFVVLDYYAKLEGFKYCFVINSAVDRLVIVNANFINSTISNNKDNVVNAAKTLDAQYPNITFLAPQTYGAQGPRAGFGITTL